MRASWSGSGRGRSPYLCAGPVEEWPWRRAALRQLATGPRASAHRRQDRPATLVFDRQFARPICPFLFPRVADPDCFPLDDGSSSLGACRSRSFWARSCWRRGCDLHRDGWRVRCDGGHRGSRSVGLRRPYSGADELLNMRFTRRLARLDDRFDLVGGNFRDYRSGVCGG